VNSELLKTLKGLRADPTLAVDLYPQLFNAQFWVLVQQSSGPIEDAMFLTYPTKDGIQELPVFTDSNHKLLVELLSLAADAEVLPVEGDRLWPRLLDVVKTKVCEAAVDPRDVYGIRLTREMILGMVNKYGSNAKGKSVSQT
jgi:type III secretion system (T3SS) SseB-like protein